MPTIDDFEELDMTGMNVDHVTPMRSILVADYGHGYKDTTRVGPVGGTRQFVISAGVWPDDETIAAIGSDSWMEYYTTFFDARLDNANEPFVIRWRGTAWLVDLAEPQYGVEVHTSNLFTPDGITLNLRRVRGIIYNDDGSVDLNAPSVPVLTLLTVLGPNSINVDWLASTDRPGDAYTLAGYDVRIDGTTVINVGNVLTYTYSYFSPGSTHSFEVRSYDNAPTPNYSDWSNALSGTTWSPTVVALASGGSLLTSDGDVLTVLTYL